MQVCQCDCGNIGVVSVRYIENGRSTNCGCVRNEKTAGRNTKHSLATRDNTVPEHNVWNLLRSRCHTVRNKDYKDYGGRGIEVCARWRDIQVGFINFYSDMGPRPGPEYTIERKDVNGNYEPVNCEWIHRSQQGRNKRNNRMLTAFGKTQCLVAWAEEFSLRASTITNRIKNKWPIESAVSLPVGSRNPTKRIPSR